MGILHLALGCLLGFANPSPTVDDELARFGELLGAVRSGQDEPLTEFVELAKRLAEERDRDDIREVAEYYAGLLDFERKQGLGDYQRFVAIWNRVLELDRLGVRGTEWQLDRRDILKDLRELAEQVELRADFVPAARAWSLSARIEVEVLALGERNENWGSTSTLFASATRGARRSLELFERAGQVRPQLEPLVTLARLERVEGDYAESRELFERCSAVAQTVGDETYRVHALQGLISLARLEGNLVEMDRLLYELAEWKQPAENWPLAWKQAERLIHEDRPEQALDFLERNPPRSRNDMRTWHGLRANAYTRLGDWDAARRETEASGNDPLRLALIDLKRDRPDLALERLASLPEGAQDGGQNLLGRITKGEALLELDRVDEALAEFEAARRAGEELETRLSIDRAETEGRSNVFGEVHGLHGVLLHAEALARSGRIRDAVMLAEEAHARRLRSHSGVNVDLVDVDAWAEQYEAGLVTFLVGPDHTLRLSLGETDHWTRIELGRRELTRAVRRLREALCEDRIDSAGELGREFLEDILGPAQEGAGRRLFLLHGALEALPIEWLLAETECVPVVLPGLPAATPGLSSETPSAWRLFGAPVASALRELPRAERELELLQELRVDAQVAAGNEFRLDAILEALDSRANLHFATHVEQREDGIRSTTRLLASAGEALRPRDIRRQAQPRNLCVLATCTSAGGRLEDSEGAQGLAQAFLETGTRNLVVTNWPVGDRAGEVFSIALHRALLEGLPTSGAVERAREELRTSGFSAADWAAFRALGRD